ncbi:MAG: sensor histidine kinase [Bacillota bacterium]
MTGWLSQIFMQNWIIVYFIYGLVFFLMGAVIALQSRQLSQFRLARALWALAAFGLLHGLSEWAVIFLPFQHKEFSETAVIQVLLAEKALTTLSFAYLFYFGAKLYFLTTGKHPWLSLWAPAAFIAWLTALVFLAIEGAALPLSAWLVILDGLTRYLLGLPGAVLSAYALLLQRSELRVLRNWLVERHVKGAGISFGVYGLFTGVFVPVSPLFPSSMINQELLFQVTGVPVPVFRSLAGIAISYYMIRSLELFDIENSRRLEIAERKQMVLDERERIGRDLHDGVIQNIYGVGLIIENTKHLIKENQEMAVAHLDTAMERLNDTIRDIRAYIMNLRPAGLQPNVMLGLQQMLAGYEVNTLIITRLEWEGEPVDLPLYQVSDFYHLVQEALNNTLKHSGASVVTIQVVSRPQCMTVKIIDDGRGFVPEQLYCGKASSGQGIKNMQERARLLGGWLTIKSNPGMGTEISMQIPLGGEGCDQNHDS